MHAGLVVTRQEAAGSPLSPSVVGQCKCHEECLARLGLNHRAVCVSFAVGMVLIGTLLGVARIGLLGLVGAAPIDLLDVYVKISEQILLEVVTLGVTSSHKLMADAPGVADDQRHFLTGGNPQRVGRERVLVQPDLDPQAFNSLRKQRACTHRKDQRRKCHHDN